MENVTYKMMEYLKLTTSNYDELYKIYPDELNYYTFVIIDDMERKYYTFTPSEKEKYGTLEKWLNDEKNTIQTIAKNMLIKIKSEEFLDVKYL